MTDRPAGIDTGAEGGFRDVIVGAVQMESRPGAVRENLQRGLRLAAHAVLQGARLVVLPECAISGYALESKDLAAAGVPFGGPETDALATFARQRGVTLVVGLLERADDGYYNTALTCLPDGTLERYRKTHLPRLGLDRFCQPGDVPFRTIRGPIGEFGVLICYDLRFPEPARVLTLAGAALLAVPTAWPPGATDYPEFLDRARASENRVALVIADHADGGAGGRFLGRSQIIASDGRILAEAGTGEEVLLAHLAAGDVDRARRLPSGADGPGGLLADRRPSLYGSIAAGGTS